MSDPEFDWKSLLDALPDAVARIDPMGRHLYVNRQWCRESGITLAECRGKTFREIGLPADLCTQLEDICRRVITEKTEQHIEHPFTGPLGEQHYSTRVVPEFNEAGEVVTLLALIRNITSRVRAERALADSESRFRAFMDHSPGVAWIKDADGRYAFISRSYERQFGVRLEDFRGRTDADVWPEAMAQKYRDNDLAVLADGQTREVIEEARNSDGSLSYWWNFKFLIRDAAGRTYVGGSGLDITQRKLAEESLAESEISLRALLETGAFVVVGMTPDYKVFEWNRAAEQVYGFRREEVLGKDYLVHFLPAEARAGVAEEIQQLLAGPPTEAYPNEVLHRDGSRRTLLWNACRLVDGKGRVRGLIAIGQDISDRIRSEEALRESETRNRELLENIHDAVWSSAVEGDPHQARSIFISDQSESIFGFSSEEFLRDTGIWFRNLHPDDLPHIVEGTRRLELGAPFHQRSYRFRHGKTGEYRWIEDRVTGQHDAHGKLIGLSGVARDVTDRKRAEAALREQEERLQLALNASHAGTWSWDVVNNVTNWDRRYHQLYEFDAEECPGFAGWIQRIHPDDRGWIEALIQAMLSPGGGDDWNVEFRTVPLSRGIRWMAGIGRVERDAQGRAIRFSGLNLDITDRKRAELAAQQSAAEIRAILEAFPDIHFWVEPDGTIRNYHAGGNTFVPPQDFLDKKMQDVLPPDVGRQVFDCICSCVADQVPTEAVYSLDESDGVNWYDARFVPLPNSSQVLVSVRNITARHRAEEESRNLQMQLLHAQKLESLGVLAGGIAHDFNNLLTAVIGFTDLAISDLPTDSTARKHLDAAMTGARRAAELTQQMLAYSGKGQFLIEAVNLSSLVQEMSPLLQMSVSKKAILRFTLDQTLPAVMADAAQMRQIVMNLVINSSDALCDGTGDITVATGVRHLMRTELAETYLNEELPEGTYAVLEVRDTGRGMDDATRAKIFDPFFTTKSAGRGLGLAAVLGIIRSHRGAIRVQSQPGEGTDMQVLLPVSSQTSVPIRTLDAAPPPAQPTQTILVVDDEEPVRELARIMLERAGFRVLTAANGQLALRIFSARPDEIDLVLLDLTMPLMSGEETFHALRNIRPGVGVLLSSGYNEQATATEFTADGFLHKPYRSQTLLAAIQQALTASIARGDSQNSN